MDLAYEAGLSASELRSLLCKQLLETPDSNNGSHRYVNVEVRTLLDEAEWNQVYDFIETVVREIRKRSHNGILASETIGLDKFAAKLNDAFRRKGVGWQLIGERIEVRGEESFEVPVRTAIAAAEAGGREVASRELHEALADLSRRPAADITGAIQHAMAALECAVREVVGDPKRTLGDLLGRNPALFPPPLNQAVEKLWGFASERGRHLREGQLPRVCEAELVVGVVGVLVAYLMATMPPQPDSTPP